ncbi:MAG TPA: MoaD/ThiS family protein [Tepidimicrobium sp.]|nr:MoaD/ThiS family protein [Tepidimicrobium sp.]
MIILKYKPALFKISKIEYEEIEAKNVKDVLDHIRRTYGKKAYKEASRMLIVVNGVSISLYKNLKTELKAGDIITFFPICGGG